MSNLLRKLEKERQELNKLGEQSLKQSIRLSDNQELQEQSRKVDELLVRYERTRRKRHRRHGR
ncbi:MULTISPECIES: hypothetical protein [Paenibacillaceae]|uniref:Aspartyl-phosphate phosphatase Spo0E family protein n=1 Tax=Marinicrinis lubricantis TaxID=2086470 RepID=A0ABW1IU36_9BACL|nr:MULTISPECIES: hypothetical protein [Paenibacillus]MED4599729.1 aspartyl-phosphate phosphatase Spo0E family protein [Paenibacillus validus]MED4604838.1 aspartyl-phosphate phosphatase Spo0E family protein [Paenibacillus validus]NTZ19096.1 aspartyl-phosphate phosphatase Spo0E family protein [Paenibacillus sp. JMULE4]